MMKILVLVILAEVWTAAGQLLLKKGANSLESHTLRGTSNIMRFIRNILSRPMIWAGLSSMAIGLVIWLVALAQGDLSLVFSMGSIQYVMILFLAHFLLGEKIDRMKLIGTLLVVLGIVFITIS